MRIRCECQCGAELDQRDGRGRVRRYLPGHGQRGKKNPGRANPLSQNHRTGRGRARLLSDCSRCELESIGDCAGVIDVHHVDKNPMNNAPENRKVLCRCHHRLVESGRIDLANPVMPPFVIRGGKRRYLYRYSAMPRSEACVLREQRKREKRAAGNN